MALAAIDWTQRKRIEQCCFGCDPRILCDLVAFPDLTSFRGVIHREIGARCVNGRTFTSGLRAPSVSCSIVDYL
jgi:hypothetical protein